MSIATPLIGIASEMIRFIDARTHLIGIGNTNGTLGLNEWPVEGSPPDVPLNLLSLEHLRGFIPVKAITPVVAHEGGDYIADGSRWLKLQHGLTAEELAIAGCRALLIEAELHHFNIPGDVLMYRSAGVYAGCWVSEEITHLTRWIDAGNAKGTLDTAWYFPAIPVQKNQVHNLQVIRRF